jgi:serine/threonine protein kinase
MHDTRRLLHQIPLSVLKESERQFALQEVMILKSLSHPNIVEHIDSFCTSNEDSVIENLNIVMSYCEGTQENMFHCWLSLHNVSKIHADQVVQIHQGIRFYAYSVKEKK